MKLQCVDNTHLPMMYQCLLMSCFCCFRVSLVETVDGDMGAALLLVVMVVDVDLVAVSVVSDTIDEIISYAVGMDRFGLS